jgi:hypothetical protein
MRLATPPDEARDGDGGPFSSFPAELRVSERRALLCRTACAERAVRRCRAGLPRRLDHPERDRLGIAHSNCDSLFAPWRRRDDPNLADKPLISRRQARRGSHRLQHRPTYVCTRDAHVQALKLPACGGDHAPPPTSSKSRIRRPKSAHIGADPLVGASPSTRLFFDLSRTRLHHESAFTLPRFGPASQTRSGSRLHPPCPEQVSSKIAFGPSEPRASRFWAGRTRRTFAGQPVRNIPGVGGPAQARSPNPAIHPHASPPRVPPGDLCSGRLGRDARRLSRLLWARRPG